MEVAARVEAALDAHDANELDDAVRQLIAELDELPTETIEHLCVRITAEREFGILARVADAAITGGRSGRFWVDLAQAHIERGTYASAMAVIEQALVDDELDTPLRIQLRGLRGRILKDRFLTAGRPDDLVQAIESYAGAVHEGGDVLWLGVNAHALAHLARRRGIAVADLDIPSEQEVMTAAKEALTGSDDWATATWIETHLLVGLPVPVDAIATQLADASKFVHASLRRQLVEVWELDDDHPAIVTLSEFLLRSGTEAEINLPTTAGGYEKLFGSEWPVAIDTYRHGLRAAESVCHIMIQGQVPIGTGFVMDGDQLHPALTGRRVLLTNEHVVPSPKRADGAPAEAIDAHFDAHDRPAVAGFRAVWWSDREDLDVTVLLSDELDSADVPTLTPGSRLPAVMPGAHVYVVGHPGGRSLCLSIRGNDLLDLDGVRIHYKAPTEKGSSGSPVFDQAWNLIGVHHYGSSHLHKLHGQSGTYGGNEGTTIEALRQRLADTGVET